MFFFNQSCFYFHFNVISWMKNIQRISMCYVGYSTYLGTQLNLHLPEESLSFLAFLIEKCSRDIDTFARYCGNIASQS